MEDNLFISHEITEMERLEGIQLSATTTKLLQNEVAALAHQIINLTYKPSQKEDYMLALRFAQGQIAVLSWVLAESKYVQNGRQGDRPTMQLPDELQS